MSGANGFSVPSAAEIGADIDRLGYAVVRSALDERTAEGIAGLFERDELFRSTIEMQRHGYGEGRYRYFREPVDPLIAAIRSDLYGALVPIANRWQRLLGREERFPGTHTAFLQHCHDAGQTLPTPLLLDYEEGGHNRLHQDRYGAVAFPLQATAMLSRRAAFAGGSFVLVEQRPRQQSRAHVIELDQGDLVIFPNEVRPVLGTNGSYRVAVRHGVADVTAGRRRTLGLILHDAA